MAHDVDVRCPAGQALCPGHLRDALRASLRMFAEASKRNEKFREQNVRPVPIQGAKQ